MDDKQKRLVRNIVSGIVLLVLVLFVMAYCGVFEGAQSDEAQIRELMERAKEETNNRDWNDFMNLCDVPDSERQAWIDAINDKMEHTQGAKLVKIDAINPKGLISVPAGATEYELDVAVLAHLDVLVTSRQMDAVEGRMFFVKKDGRWFINLDKSADAFPHVPRPKR